MVRTARFHPKVLWSRFKVRVPLLVWLLVIAAAVFLATLNRSGLVLAGVVEKRETPVGTTIAGKVAEVLVVPGQVVSNGQHIAQLDTTDLDTQLGAALWDRAMEVMDVDRQFTQISRDVGTRLKDRSVSLAEDQAEMTAIEQELERLAELDQRYIDPQVVANLKARRAALAEAVRTYPELLQHLREYRDWAEAQKATLLEAMNPRVYNDSPMVDSVRRIELEIEKTRILSPAHGVVAGVDVSPGQWVDPGVPLLRLVQTNDLTVLAMVDEGGLDPAVGDEFLVRVTRASGRQYFRARVISLAPGIDEIPQDGGLFFKNVKRGRFVRLEMLEDAPLLPGQAVAVVARKPMWDEVMDWGREQWRKRRGPETETVAAAARR